jgi:hypothetical protein
VKLPRRSDACAVQPEALKDADVKDRIALRSQDLLPSRGSEHLAAALGVPISVCPRSRRSLVMYQMSDSMVTTIQLSELANQGRSLLRSPVKESGESG